MVTLRESEVMRELLIMGRDSAAELNTLLQNDGPTLAQELATTILKSLDGVLSLITATPFSPTDPGEVSHISVVGSPVSCVDSGESDNRLAVRDRRGGYKRRRALESHIQVSTTMEDGYAWRKYGQKVILNAKYPRCYYRCTHKLDQGCLANKQVQIISEEPKKFQIIYFGLHTCTNVTKKLSNFNVGMNHEDPHLISFDPKSSSISTEQKYNPTSIEKLTLLNKEDIEEETSSDPKVDMELAFWPNDPIAYTHDLLPELWSFGGSISSSGGDMGVEYSVDCFDFDKVFSS